jgi:hypothetical protein
MSNKVYPPGTSVEDLFKKLKKTAEQETDKNNHFDYTKKKNKQIYFKEKAIIRLRNDKIHISNVTTNGPMVFGFYPFRWAYALYNSVKDYFFSRGYYTFVKAPLLEGTVKAAVNHVDTLRMHKIGEIDMIPQTKE